MAASLLKGSDRKPVMGARSVGAANADERLEVTILLRRGNAGALKQLVSELARPKPTGKHLSREEFSQKFGAVPADISAVKSFAAAHRLSVVQEHAGRRTMVLSGTVAQFNTAFGVQLQKYEYEGGTYRGRAGGIQLPDELNGVVEAVLGLDNRPAAKPHFRARHTPGNVRWHPDSGTSTSFTPLQIAQLYSFPPGDGQNQCVGIIELGGGERAADLRAYFSNLDIRPTPSVITASVDHAVNHPTGDPNGPDGEVMLDIEVIGAIVPKADLVVYFAPNTDAGFLDAITTAIHDTKHKPSVISISWGGPESSWTQQSMTAFDSAFQAAVALGVTICVASGDNGSSGGVADGADHVDFPASSTYALACGGTSVQVTNNSITNETVWNDGPQGGAGGGGVSSFFPLPAWQDGLKVTRPSGGSAPLQARGIPDVSGDADPHTGYDVRVDGADTVIGWTSAVAPLWAGLIARINAARLNAGIGAAVGFVNPTFYATQGAFNDITQGNNGGFAAAIGWDACTGLGTPKGNQILSLFVATPTS